MSLYITMQKSTIQMLHVTEWPRIIGFHASIWSSIYRADFVKKIKIPETAGASYQDLPFMIDVMCKAKRISVVKKPFVHWRNEPKQGNSTSARGKKLLLMGKNTETATNVLVIQVFSEPTFCLPWEQQLLAKKHQNGLVPLNPLTN